MCKGKELPQNINMLSFNVEGLKPNLEDSNFLEFIKDYDLSILSKTWKADTSKLNIEGFWDYSQVRPRHKNATRHSGGITIIAKHNIRPELKLVENSEGFLWIRLEQSFFKLENDIFLCGAYIPPKNTTQNILSKTDYFGSLENSILKYKDKGNIVIMGDLNARTGIEDHTLCLNNHLSQLLPDTNAIQDGNPCSCDDKKNSYGRILLKLQ